MQGSGTIMPGDEETAVQVTGAWKSYSKYQGNVLSDLCMNVLSSSVYGLLGESGCGKTTLMRCILGLQELDAGRISVWGEQPGTASSGIPGSRVGYMPQDISMYLNLTVEETLYLFGSFHGISPDDIKSKTKFYVKLLDIPKKSRLVEKLSGGQQRRVSFAVSLFHEPDLLVLDEPTVGVDPILRQTIWKHLRDLSKSGKTIIISTHYIEEVKQAHKVGFIRSGRILAENTPLALLERHCTNSLEEVFLREARQDERKNSSRMIQQCPDPLIVKKKRSGNYSLARILSWSILKTMLWKEGMRIYRHPALIFLILTVPILAVVLPIMILRSSMLTSAFGVINHEYRNCSSSSFQRRTDCNLTALSCSLLHYISVNAPLLTLHAMNDVDEANAAIRSGKIYGAFVFPESFSESFAKRVIEGRNADTETLIDSNMVILRDGVSFLTEVGLAEMLLKTIAEFTSDVLRSCGLNPGVTRLPMEFESVYGSFSEVTLDHCSVLAFIVIMNFTLAMAYSAYTYIEEKRFLTLDRLWASGVNIIHFTAGYVSIQYIMSFLQCVTLFTVIYLLGIPFNISPIWPTVLLLLQTTLGSAIGSFITYVVDDEIIACQLITLVVFVNVLVSGVAWPTEFFGPALRLIARLSPCTLVTDSIRGMLLIGWGILHPAIWPGFVLPVIWTASICIAFYLYVRFKKFSV